MNITICDHCNCKVDTTFYKSIIIPPGTMILDGRNHNIIPSKHEEYHFCNHACFAAWFQEVMEKSKRI